MLDSENDGQLQDSMSYYSEDEHGISPAQQQFAPMMAPPTNFFKGGR